MRTKIFHYTSKIHQYHSYRGQPRIQSSLRQRLLEKKRSGKQLLRCTGFDPRRRSFFKIETKTEM